MKGKGKPFWDGCENIQEERTPSVTFSTLRLAAGLNSDDVVLRRSHPLRDGRETVYPIEKEKRQSTRIPDASPASPAVSEFVRALPFKPICFEIDKCNCH